jgi:aspartate/methionine/tyrosine aminotransferase
MLPETSNYLEWARAAEILAASQPIANLYSSAVYPPKALLHEDLKRAYAGDFMQRLSECNSWGHPRLIKALAREYGVNDPARILPTSGCSIAYIVAAQALLKAGDHVLVEHPVYDPFIKVLDTLEVSYSFTARPGLDDLEAQITPRTRLIVVSHLHNPTGAPLSPAELERLIAAAERHNLHVIVDQIFADWVDPEPLARQHPRLITLNGLSKVYGLTELRLGWIIADTGVMAQIRPIHNLYDNSLSHILQTMATVVFDEYSKYRQRAFEIAAANRPLMVDFLGQNHAHLHGDVPDAGIVAFPQVIGIEDVDEFVRYALEQHGVLVVPGRFFGAPSHVRLGFGGETQALRDGLTRLTAAFNAYPAR